MIVDIIVGIILVGSAIISFLRGFIREVLTIFGIVGGMVAAYIGGPLLIPSMSKWLGIKEGEEVPKLFDAIPYDFLANILSYGAVFLGFAIVLSIISHLLSEGASRIGLGALDRTLGVVFGLARGVLVLGLIYLPFMYLASDETRADWFAGSKTHIYLEATAGWIGNFIPKETIDEIKENAEKVEEANGTREKLRDLGMLPGEENKEGDDELQQKELKGSEAPINKKEGYTEQFRNEMQDLIEQNTVPQEEEAPQQQQNQPSE